MKRSKKTKQLSIFIAFLAILVISSVSLVRHENAFAEMQGIVTEEQLRIEKAIKYDEELKQLSHEASIDENFEDV